MSALLARLAPRQALGIYAAEGRVAISQVAATLLGPVEVARASCATNPDNLPEAVGRLLASIRGTRRRALPAAVGLAPGQVFFSTRPVRAASRDAAPEVLLHEVLQSAAISVDDMVVDMVKSQPGARRVVSLAACRKKYLSSLLASLEKCPVRLVRAEPAPCALLRVASRHAREPRRVRVVFRVFLGREGGLAVVTASRLPIVWRNFPLPAGEERTAVVSIVRRLQTIVVSCGVDATLGGVLVHGRPGLREAMDSPPLREALGTPVWWAATPDYDEEAVAHGLALGCLAQHTPTFDLSRSVKAPPTMRELVPWGELALVGSVLACMALFLNVRRESLEDSYAALKAQNAKRAWLAGASQAHLVKEKQDLKARVEALRHFMNTRVSWSGLARDVAAPLPENAALTLLSGVCATETAGRAKESAALPAKQLMLKGTAPQKDGRSAPAEIDAFLEALRSNPALRSDFPVIEIAGIQGHPGIAGAKPVAEFMVLGLPRAEKGNPKPRTRPDNAVAVK